MFKFRNTKKVYDQHDIIDIVADQKKQLEELERRLNELNASCSCTCNEEES